MEGLQLVLRRRKPSEKQIGVSLRLTAEARQVSRPKICDSKHESGGNFP